ncbi:MAG: plasmid mobilization protein [Brevundimonas sp.]
MRAARERAFHVVLSDEEHAHIKATAASAGMSMAEVVRRLTKGVELKSRLDGERVEEIIRTRGDLNRLGNLLKLWLDQRPGEGASAQEVAALAEQIAATSEEIRQKVRAL